MSANPLALAEQTVPRYTSYPTAPHFHAGVTADSYAQWLAALDPGQSISLYLHVPFCVELCLYCGCHTKATHRPEPVTRYVEMLRREIALVAKHLGPRRVAHIHWGGGTPSSVGPAQVRAIMEDLRRHFDLGSLREHAIELDPRHVGPALIDTLATIRINRASLGVQDFSAHVQRAIGRQQPYDTVATVVERLRGAGISSLNFDLMYGLPTQTTDDIARTAQQACDLAPTRIALFGYAHVPWMRKQQRLIDEAALPDSAERLRQAQAARAVFLDEGYQAIGFDHFALPADELAHAARGKRLRRNFQGYTADDSAVLIGLGASAIGRLPHGYVQNAADVAGYSRAVSHATFATVRGFELSPDDKRRGEMIERLLCDMELDLKPYMTRDASCFAPARFALQRYVAQGLLTLEDDVVRVTERGRDFARLIAAVFDAYRDTSPGRHSKAV